MTEELKKRISNFQPSPDGRWFHEGQGEFYRIAEQLLEKGFTEQEAGDILERLYNTVANEYGD